MAEVNGNGNGNGVTAKWQLRISIATGGVVVLGSLIGFFVGFADLRNSEDIAKSRIASLEERLKEDEHNQATDRLDITTIRSDLSEVETQFCGAADVTNLFAEDADRRIVVLWQKSGLGMMPARVVFPHECHPRQQSDVRR